VLQSSVRVRLEDFLAPWSFFVLRRRSLLDFWLEFLSAFGPSLGRLVAWTVGHGATEKNVQATDALKLFWRGLGGHSITAGEDNGVVQATVAAAGVVRLLATVVGMDHDGI
jgi:hypothetical protein